MKFIIASDIHGSAKYCRMLLNAFDCERADKLLLLGDILYHGPRNPLPDEYSPKTVAQSLEKYADKIISVRGNCESEVDQLVLNFPALSDYAAVFADGINIYLSHGHREIPPLNCGDVYLTGHTHVPHKKTLSYYHLNPGSVSLPKENSCHSYIVYETRTFYFKNLETGEIYDSLKI